MKQEIYANLNKGGVSVRENGKVTGCYGKVIMRNVRFKVTPSGHKSVIETGQRNVHATAIGQINLKADAPSLAELTQLRATYPRIQYNPFRSDKFTCNGKPIESATAVVMVITDRFSEPNKQGRKYKICEMFLVEA
jgi:hypothetical protein